MAPIRILIADDHETIRKGVCSILMSRCDLEVCGEAANGRQAIEKARELSPDLVILDITMPVLGGFAAAQEIRKFLRDVPILFFSIHESRQSIEEAKLAGGQGYVSKAQAGTTLLKALDTLLDKQTFFPGEAVVSGRMEHELPEMRTILHRE